MLRGLTQLIALAIFVGSLFLFAPILKVFLSLTTSQLWHLNYAIVPSESTQINSLEQSRFLRIPKDNFWLAIPKLGVISIVDEAVNFNLPESQKKSISQGKLIHSLDSVLPGEWGTTIISSHLLSQTNWPTFNPEYFFANRLKLGDEIIVGYGGNQYKYEIDTINTIESIPDLSPDDSSKNLIFLSSSPFINGPRIQINAEIKQAES